MSKKAHIRIKVLDEYTKMSIANSNKFTEKVIDYIPRRSLKMLTQELGLENKVKFLLQDKKG